MRGLISRLGYPERRMILDKAEGCKYVAAKNGRIIYAVFLRMIRKIFPSFSRSNIFGDGALFTTYVLSKKFDLVHSFNRVLLDSNHKWVATFETTLPAFFNNDPASVRKYMNKRLKHILSDNCKALMPMSEWAYKRELQLLSDFASSDELQIVQQKMKVLYPPQECLCTNEDVHKKCQGLRDSKIRFLYVGRDFVRKGGEIALRVFDELSREYDNFSVIAVGTPKIEIGRYNLTEEERRNVMHIMENSSWLQFYDSLPNDKVIELAKEANVGLLPTFADTFGFSILEMQACGCPVITTNGEARAEINDDMCGWIIDTKNIKPNESMRSIISSQLKNIVRNILEDPSCIEQKAIHSIERIIRHHSLSNYSDELRKIYSLCL